MWKCYKWKCACRSTGWVAVVALSDGCVTARMICGICPGCWRTEGLCYSPRLQGARRGCGVCSILCVDEGSVLFAPSVWCRGSAVLFSSFVWCTNGLYYLPRLYGALKGCAICSICVVHRGSVLFVLSVWCTEGLCWFFSAQWVYVGYMEGRCYLPHLSGVSDKWLSRAIGLI